MRISLVVISVVFLFLNLNAQKNKTTDSVQGLNLDQCIVYALQHQPAVLQAAVGIRIAQKTNLINLSAWIPQLNLSGSLIHYYQLPTAFITNPIDPEGPLLVEHTGVNYTFIPQLSATETLFSPYVLFAAKSAHYYVQQAKQSSDSTKINLIATVSKAFYGLLNNVEQIKVLKEDTARLTKNLKDTYHQYVGGIVDKTDYKEATISLNNSKAQLKQTEENMRPLYASLKQLIGFPPEKEFTASFDTLQMIREITFDTAQQLNYEKRIEYQQIQTAKFLQKQTIRYYQSQYLPTVSAFYNYDYECETNTLPNLLSQVYPYSYLGATVSIPIFTGFQRVASIQKAKLQAENINYSELNLKSSIYSDYTSALANYKGNFYNLTLLKENVTMAKDVYVVVSLQYKQGVVAYLNVITAESNLISSEISYLNALFQVLSSKVDLEKAMGNIAVK